MFRTVANCVLRFTLHVLRFSMSTPKQRHTRARRDRARVFLKLKKKDLIECSHCEAMIPSHVVCPKCGFYKNKEVVDTLKKISKKSKSKK